MDILLKKLRRKFTISTALVSGLFLLFIFISFFLLVYGSFEISADHLITDILKANNPDSQEKLGDIIVFTYSNDTPQHVSGNMAIFDNDAAKNEFYKKAVQTSNGGFSVGSYVFRVQNKQTDKSPIVFVVYNFTKERQMLIVMVLIQICVYIVSMSAAVFLSYIFSKKALEPVQEAFKRQRDLIANASHELKTPITIVSTNLSVLKSEPKSTVEDNTKWIDSIESQLTRMNGLVTNMLNLSKMEHDAPVFKKINLSQIAESEALNFEVVCFEKNVSLVTNIKPDVYISGEEASIERVITILLDNAVKYCGDHGKIALKLTTEKKDVKLSVLNTGQSISKEEASHVFDRFYRADGARQNPDNQSFGLGLAIAYETVAKHNGIITCRGVPNRGTIFEIKLPIYKNKKHYSDKN